VYDALISLVPQSTDGVGGAITSSYQSPIICYSVLQACMGVESAKSKSWSEAKINCSEAASVMDCRRSQPLTGPSGLIWGPVKN